MTTLIRQLFIAEAAGDTKVTISIEPSELEDADTWMCGYAITWPTGTKHGVARGFDAIQALYLAMQQIVVNLYASPYHVAGTLRWGKPGTGYGFPMPRPGIEDLIGEDRYNQVP